MVGYYWNLSLRFLVVDLKFEIAVAEEAFVAAGVGAVVVVGRCAVIDIAYSGHMQLAVHSENTDEDASNVVVQDQL
mgnify:CR=1 FL=1